MIDIKGIGQSPVLMPKKNGQATSDQNSRRRNPDAAVVGGFDKTELSSEAKALSKTALKIQESDGDDGLVNLRPLLDQTVSETQADALPVSVTTCARHPLNKVAGECRYCERELCSDCLVPKNDFLICADKVDCLRHMKKPEIDKAERVRKMFREFSERPNARIIDQLTNTVLDAKDPEITDAILESFGFQCTNLGVYGLAIHRLGLVRDARTLHCLTRCFDALSDLDALPRDPRLRVICADHLRRSAQAILQWSRGADGRTVGR